MSDKFKGTKENWEVKKDEEFSNAYYLYPTHPFAEQDANAKLMSSAPALLEACIKALRHHQGGHSELGFMLREVIKKATGTDVPLNE